MLRNLLKDTAIYGCADFFFKLVSFATFPLFTNALSVSEFGVFALMITLSNLLGICLNAGLNSAVQKYYFDPTTSALEKPLIVSTGLFTLLFNGLCLLTLFLTGAHFFAQDLAFSQQVSWEMFCWAAVCSLGLQLNTYCFDVVRAHFKPWNFMLLNLVQNACLIGLSLLFVLYLQKGVTGYLMGTALGYICTAPLCLFMIRYDLTSKIDLKWAKALLRFGYPLIFVGIAYWIFGSMDRWMLGELSSTTEVGLFSIAFKIASVLIFLNLAFSQAWSPHALRAHRQDSSYRLLYSHFLSLWFFVLIVLSTTISLFSRELLMWLTPSEYWPAAHLMPFVCMSLAFFGIVQILAMPLLIEKKTTHFIYASWIAAAGNFLLNYLLIPNYGAQGAAFATLCANIILAAYYAAATQYYHPLPLEKRKLYSCLFLAAASVCANLWFDTLTWNTAHVVYKTAFLLSMLAIGIKRQLLDLKMLKPLVA